MYLLAWFFEFFSVLEVPFVVKVYFCGTSKGAFAVTEILINNFGISAQRVTAMGFGIEQPIQKEISVRANALNRRIEAKINS